MHREPISDPLVDVLVPIYGRADLLRDCVESLLGSQCTTQMRIVLIDDCSPFPEVLRLLEHLASDPRLVLVRNERNLGFAASVNRGFDLAPTRDIVVLNSDTRVSTGWLDRLHSSVLQDPAVATASPMSNNATICSFPDDCSDNALPDHMDPPTLDRVLARVNRGRSVEIPTSVGFCMYIRRAALDDVGYFDEQSFRAGYGEENDFCMRARRRGWRHRLCGDVFVFHHGGASFGQQKASRERSALAILERRHPRYPWLVREHLRRDPARALRLRGRMAVLLEDPRPAVLFVSHALGGGTERHMAELAEAIRQQAVVLSLRSRGDGSVELALSRTRSDAIVFQGESEYGPLLELLARLDVRRVHVHHTLALPEPLWTLARDLDAPLDFTIHDYYAVNGNPTLTDRRGRHCGDHHDRDRRCARSHQGPDLAGMPAWRARHRKLLASAERVFAPSKATARRIQDDFPALPVTVAPPPDARDPELRSPPRFRPLRPDEPMRVGVLGALSREKGADVLEAVAKKSMRRNLPLSFCLIGYAYRKLHRSVAVTGAYEDARLDEAIRDLDPHVLWFPARWAETYSYTLSAALRAGTPIVATDLGAFPERVAGRPATWIESWALGPSEWLARFAAIREELERAVAGPPQPWTEQCIPSRFDYGTDYLPSDLGPSRRRADDFEVLMALVGERAARPPLSRGEHVVRALADLRSRRGVAPLVTLIPEPLQRSTKRLLTRRPMGDLS